MCIVSLKAIGLLLVFEGILPFLSPDSWRQMMQQMCLQPSHVIRIIGLVSMLLGLGVVSLVHYYF